MDWQSYTAIGIVIVTLLIFLMRLARAKPGCGQGCDCGEKTPDFRLKKR
jgi:hypothetical protein